ncbi:MAG TPA: ATP-binding protein [Blastocatellia bacterium]|nr:ATP-binding protein [Blastocatellia bacterium]
MRFRQSVQAPCRSVRYERESRRASNKRAHRSYFLSSFIVRQSDTMPKTRTRQLQHWLPKLAEAGLSGDRQRLELLLLSLIRAQKLESPELSDELGAILAQFATSETALRWKDAGPPPTDAEEGFALVRNLTLDCAPTPVLPHDVFGTIHQFIRERQFSQRLFSEGFAPPASILITGLPGTGKTMLARWIAHTLGLPFIVQDLAVSISSFLGKTGFNLKRTLDYGRARPCLLLLDEFDAIAKRRDDNTELGEFKRIVNVLLKELEDWPSQSVLVAATNHPDLLDRAIGRRFHIVVSLPMPGRAERFRILEQASGRFSKEIPADLLEACATMLKTSSGSDLETLMHAAIRKHLATDVPLSQSLVTELRTRCDRPADRKSFGSLVRTVQNATNGHFTVRELAAIFGKSVSTIHHHLKKES